MRTLVINKANINQSPEARYKKAFEIEQRADRGTTFTADCVRINRWGISKMVLYDIKMPESNRTGFQRIEYIFLRNETDTIPLATDPPAVPDLETS